jgi:hypothetical protein
VIYLLDTNAWIVYLRQSNARLAQPRADGNGGSARFSSQYIALPRALHSIRPKFNLIQQPPKHGSIANQSASTQSKIAGTWIQLALSRKVRKPSTAPS